MVSLASNVYVCNVRKKLLLVVLIMLRELRYCFSNEGYCFSKRRKEFVTKNIAETAGVQVNTMVVSRLTGYNMTGADRKDLNSSVLTYHRIVEAFKFAYAYRALLGDEDFWDVEEVSHSCVDTEKSL